MKKMKQKHDKDAVLSTTGTTYQRNTIVTIGYNRKREERQKYIVSTRFNPGQVSTNETIDTPQQSQSLLHRIP
jgi:hypothetical protein